jgi:hypothetical protein
MATLQKKIRSQSSDYWISNYDDRPAKLFDGLEHIRASIILLKVSKKLEEMHNAYTTNLVRWYTEYRPLLFNTIFYNSIKGLEIEGSIPKIGDDKVKSIVKKVFNKKQVIGSVYSKSSPNIIYYYRSPLYWIRSMNFLPMFSSPSGESRSIHHFKSFNVINENYTKIIGAIINSSLFYLWFIVYGNGRNIALRDIQLFPCDIPTLFESFGKQLNSVFDKLISDYKVHSEIRKRADGVIYQEFYPSYSKGIMDEVDKILAKDYQLSVEELDFVINYDIKYRLGSDHEETEEE